MATLTWGILLVKPALHIKGTYGTTPLTLVYKKATGWRLLYWEPAKECVQYDLGTHEQAAAKSMVAAMLQMGGITTLENDG